MNLPSSTPRKNTVKVVFVKDFEPYKVKTGDVRYVSKSVARRLHDSWKCVERPVIPEDTPLPVEKPAKKKSVYEVKVKLNDAGKSLMKRFGSSWHPLSEQIVWNREQLQELLDMDAVEVLSDIVADSGTNLHPHTSEDTYLPIQPKPWEHATPVFEKHNPYDSLLWYISHNDWNGQPIYVAVNCINLAFQCGIEESNNVLIEWIKRGEIENKNGKISWNA